MLFSLRWIANPRYNVLDVSAKEDTMAVHDWLRVDANLLHLFHQA